MQVNQSNVEETTQPSLQRVRILRRREVERMLGISRSSIYAAVAAGELPAPVRLAANAVGWVEAELIEWIESKIRQRDSTAHSLGYTGH